MSDRSHGTVALPEVQVRPGAALAATAIALSWTQFAFVAADAGRWQLPAGAEPAILLVGGFLSPLWALLAVGGLSLGRRSLSRLLRESVRVAAPIGVYVVAAGGTAAAVAAAGMLTPGIGMPFGNDSFSVAVLAGVVAGGLVANLVEELAWRAWLQRGLRRFLGPVAASAAVGVAWALWHLPLLYIDGTAQADAGLSLTTFGPLLVVTSVVFGLLYERSDGSVWPVTVAHTTFNASIALALATASPTEANRLLVALTAVFAAVAAAVVVGGRLSQQGHERVR